MREKLEDVERDISAFKAEVFACESGAIDESCGFGEELVCLCRSPDVKPWQRCPIHDGVVD